MLKGQIQDNVQAELAARELARRRLIEFATYTAPWYEPGAVHRLLADTLEQVELYVRTGGSEGIGRLMVFMPPRHGKSEMVSVRFPAWVLGRNPDWRVILASCTASLAEGFSRQNRDMMRDAPYRALFGDRAVREGAPVRVSDESRAVNAWDLAGYRGGMVAAGVGGSIIGRGAHLFVLDDPIKNRAEAESRGSRDAIDDWYRSTAYTRLEPGAAVVLMHQRWHGDDLAGRLIRRMVTEKDADQWFILSLPSLAEEWAASVTPHEVLRSAKQGWWMSVDPLGRWPGEPLWPERFGREALGVIRANLGGYEWDALHQQRPRPREGAMIRAYEIPIVDEAQVPRGLREVRYWDLAVSGSARADWIVGARVGQDGNGRIYIRDIARLRGPWAEARPRMVEVMLRDGVSVEQGVETSGTQAGYYQELKKDPCLQSRIIRGVNPARVGNKEVRAQVWASRIPDGLVFMVRGPWNDTFISEAVAFPAGQYDDQVDGVSGAKQMLGGARELQSANVDWYGAGSQQSEATPGRNELEVEAILSGYE